jgi:membrane-bound metal-dependent hydrolase YbcI (DUF457 family)
MFHHGATHSLTAATVFAGAMALVYGRLQREAFPKLFLVLLALYASHLGLDVVTLDTSAPHGVPLFWPWSGETYESPWMLLPNVQHTQAPLVSAHNVLLMVREAVIFVPLVGLTEVLTHRGRPGRWGPAAIYGAWFAAALTISVVSLR